MQTLDDARLKRMAQAVVLPRPYFREIYDALVKEKGGYPFKLVQTMVAPTDPPFFEAFRQARDSGWIDLLVERLLAVDAFPETNEDSAAGHELRVELQNLVQPSLGFLEVDMLRSGAITAVRRVCRIVVSGPAGESFGTGFLVGPQAVITSWHVVAPVLEAFVGKEDESAKGIRVEFDAVGALQTATTVGVAKPWLVGKSRIHPREKPPASLVDFEGVAPDGFDKHLDYALIRLDRPVGRERGYYRLDPSRKPTVDGIRTQITLFQHPAGTSMRAAVGNGVALWPPRIETRFRHNANSMPGSSGGLILDADFEPVALHQCGIRGTDGKAIINGAIPTACIAANDNAFEGTTGLDPLWRISETDAPVIGREKFQTLVLDAIAGTIRIIAVRGERESGKSFSATILQSLLNVVEHSIIDRKAAEISPVPERLVADLLSAMGIPISEKNPLPNASDTLTARDAWIRETLYPEFVKRAREAAGKRTLWLVIDDLDTNSLATSASRHFLERLYQDIASLPFLRIVLLGLTGVVPAGSPRYVRYDDVAPVTLAEIEIYLKRRFVERKVQTSGAEEQRLAAVILNTIAMGGSNKVKRVAELISTAVDPVINDPIR